MKNLILLLFTVVLFCSSCNNDDDGGVSITEYKLEETNNSGISGSAFVVGNSFLDHVSTIDIQLLGTSLEESYTAYIYNNSLSNGGDIVLELDDFFNLEGSDLLISGTNFDSLNELIIDDKFLTYPEFIAFDGHIKIFNTTNNDEPILVAQGNIGVNAQ